ncbi:hypothetical protein GRJ2_000903000 [Grus japonensis]|uniref:Uncharacterized protein n=1 Tax=Grus japonensis TaxID=30415 RepID=A0ABC9WIA3_GRUJA
MLWHADRLSAHPETAKRYQQRPDSAPHSHTLRISRRQEEKLPQAESPDASDSWAQTAQLPGTVRDPHVKKSAVNT